LVRVHLEGLEELFEEDFAGMNRGQRLGHIDNSNYSEIGARLRVSRRPRSSSLGP
jgi:hypothetical protein